jgi:hypothetical protein
MQTLNSNEYAPNPEVILRSLANLDKYAGWLSKGFAPSRVRASVKALGVEVAANGDVPAALEALDADIGSLGSGEVAALLRRAARDFRGALEPDAR